MDSAHSHAEETIEYTRLTFKVTDTRGKSPLISGSDSLCLKLVNIYADEMMQVSDIIPLPLAEKTIVETYSDVFRGLGCIGEPYKIEVDPEVTPIVATPRRWPVAKTEAIKRKLQEMENQQIIAWVEEATSWVSNMVAVECNNKLHLCINPVHTINKAIQRRHFQLPTIEEVLPKLANAKVFSFVDALNSSTQVSLDEPSSYLTTMRTLIGRVRWLRMPYGISSAPEEYQWRQAEVLEGLDGIANIADDPLVYGCGNTDAEAERDHDAKFKALLERCRQRNLKLTVKKLHFKEKTVPFMWHVLTSTGVQPDPAKVQAIVSMPEPEDARAAQRFLGMVNYVSKFCPNLSAICKPVHDYLHSDNVPWAELQQAAFKEAKQLIASAPTLCYYDVTQTWMLQVDTSEYGLGAALLQHGQPVAFASRSPSESERRYAQIEKECLAICFGMIRFDQYVYSKNNITAESDHKPLETIFKKPLSKAPCRLQTMMMRLQCHSFQVQYKQGNQMYLADTLSRAPQPTTDEAPDMFEVFAVEVHRVDRTLRKSVQRRYADCRKRQNRMHCSSSCPA